ncbi:hypothetical protein PR048_011631 [Dryococelus australis]|uniref:Mutator-like transposase domain-containing protein n=1 Tax=Dryococelus australis TaxID=614101 RepID=A0ABQ9HM29_9NEOP|nr:hypothetical protein PR048_011631 [Dryococelus australis]
MKQCIYEFFIDDGNSSAYTRLVQNVSYGCTILKLECTNRCVKNYTGHLHKLAAHKTFLARAQKILKQSIPWLLPQLKEP